MRSAIVSYVAVICNTNLPSPPQDNPPVVPTTEEKEFVYLLGDFICFLKKVFDVEEGTEAGGRLLAEMLKAARGRALDDLQSTDLTEEDAVILYHDMSLGLAAKA